MASPLQRLNNRLRWPFVLWLTFMWILLMGDLTWGNLIAGVLLGLAVVLVLPLPPVPRQHTTIRWDRLIMFVLRWLWDLIVASARVAWLALRPDPTPKGAIVQVPMRVSSELVLYLATCAYNLQPGGTVTDINVANRLWTVHLLNASTPQALEREIQNVATLERQMIDIFENPPRSLKRSVNEAPRARKVTR
ncbi:Na+/H+ antiporter subunit E [Corynebacterium riegelii]|uniref:Na+/H+ antiporter subunit E n=1 Tax=Corynebacterium riegelii TaxID=156976 RepID=UPI001920006B|nr:Na+/H+ antiporter subunit E [Corynebacterium riegelii]QQU84263.1 Na+/H+ antiporter subunit E [Corynebacterium riegelii]